MRWNCPHCGISLSVIDEKLSTGWSFSRCYHCAKFALVRRAEVNLIKVDQAPVGESILQTQPNETALLSRQANERLASLVSGVSRVPAPPPPPAAVRAPMKNPLPFANSGFPNRGPYHDEKPRMNRALPIAITAAGVLALSSGIFLYIQGQSIFEKSAPHSSTTVVPHPVETLVGAEIILPKYSKPAPKQESPRATAPKTIPKKLEAPVTTAMNRPAEDQIQSSAMAPERIQPTPNDATDSNLIVRVREKTANLYQGPSYDSPLIGKAQQRAQFLVIDWSNRWFKIELPQEMSGNLVKNQRNKKMAWIRNELVELVSTGGLPESDLIDSSSVPENSATLPAKTLPMLKKSDLAAVVVPPASLTLPRNR
jgi:hypothetical protein